MLTHITLDYGADTMTWATMNCQDRKLEVNELRIPRWMGGVSHEERSDQIITEDAIGPFNEASVANQITEKIIKGYGHAGSREEGHLLRRMADL